MALTWRTAPEVKSVALDLIEEHHRHLNNTKIVYAFFYDAKDPGKVTETNGKILYGRCVKVSGRNAFLNRIGGEADEEEIDDEVESGEGDDAFFVIEISYPIWRRLTESERIALVDHELSHAWIVIDDEGEERLKVLPHDLEEFNAVYKRHGAWKRDIEQFIGSGQLVLPEVEDSIIKAIGEPGKMVEISPGMELQLAPGVTLRKRI